MNKFLLLILTLLFSTVGYAAGEATLVTNSDQFQMTSISTVDPEQQLESRNKPRNILELREEFTSAEFLRKVPGFDETHKFLEAVLGQGLAECAATLGESGCDQNLNNLMYVFEIVKWIPLLILPALIGYALVNAVLTTAATGRISAKGYDGYYVLRAIVGGGLIFSGVGMPLTVLMMLFVMGFYWSIQVANYANYHWLDTFVNQNTDFDTVTVQSLSAGQKLSHMMICSSSLQEIKSGTPSVWEKMIGQEPKTNNIELASYVLVDKHGKTTTELINKNLWEAPFHNPTVDGEKWLKRIDFGVDGLCGKMHFKHPKELIVPEGVPTPELSDSQKVYHTAMNAAIDKLFGVDGHLNMLAFHTGFFAYNAPAKDKYGIVESNAWEAIYSYPDDYISYIQDDYHHNLDDSDEIEKAQLTVYHGAGLVNTTIYMLRDIENIMETAVKRAGIVADMLEEAKHRGVMALSGYGGALVVSNKGANQAYRDLFNSFEIKTPVKTCDSWIDDWFGDDTENCNRVITATATLESIFKTSLTKIKAKIESGEFVGDENLLLVLNLSEYEIRSMNGSNSVGIDALESVSSSVMNYILEDSKPQGPDYSPQYWVNPFEFTQRLGENLLMASYTITGTSIIIAGVAGAAQSIPFAGGFLWGSWQYIDAGAATISALTYGLSFLMTYSTQIFFFIAMVMVGVAWVQRFIIGMWGSIAIPVNLMVGGEGMMGYNGQRSVMLFISLIFRPILDIGMIYASVAAIYVVNGLVTANFWMMASNAFADRGVLTVLMLMLAFVYIQYSVMMNMYQFIRTGADTAEELMIGRIFDRIQTDNELISKADSMVSQIGATGGVRGSSYRTSGFGGNKGVNVDDPGKLGKKSDMSVRREKADAGE